MTLLTPLSDVAPEAIEALLDSAFGTGRHGRTAYAVRAGMEPVAEFSFAAIEDGQLLGSLQSWPIALTTPDGALPLIMVGPVAVNPDYQNRGIGKTMTRVVAERLDAAEQSSMLIGDPEYYSPFGFISGPAQHWTLPGPVEAHRILLRAAPGSHWPERGELGPDALRSGEGMLT